MNPRSSFLHRTLRRLPGGRAVSERLASLEEQVWPEPETVLSALPAPVAVAPAPPMLAADRLLDLLNRSQEQSREEAEEIFFARLLEQLVPDQARILAALSDSPGYPLVNLMAGSRLGFDMQPVLELVSSVGRSAGVQCPEFTPAYLRGLLGLGLVEVRAVESPDITKYELLETDATVRRLMEQCMLAGRRCRVVRRTVHLSATGERLWAACRPDTD